MCAVHGLSRVGYPAATEVRRRLIVEAAVPLIAERGYASVGVRDVAAAAGVSVGTVGCHFGSVQEILSEAMVLQIERYYTGLSEAADRATSGAEGLRLLVDALFAGDVGVDPSEVHGAGPTPASARTFRTNSRRTPTRCR